MCINSNLGNSIKYFQVDLVTLVMACTYLYVENVAVKTSAYICKSPHTFQKFVKQIKFKINSNKNTTVEKQIIVAVWQDLL